MVARGVAKLALVIGGVAAGSVAAFERTAGVLTPGRLTPERYIAALRPPGARRRTTGATTRTATA